MALKKLSDCGHICLVILGSVVLILTIISFSVTWWYLYWDDCSFFDDASVSLNLKLGLCTDGMSDCTAWDDLDIGADEEDTDAYVAAHGICVTALVFTVLFLVFTCTAFIPAVKESAAVGYLRFVLIFIMLLVSVFLISAMASTTDTWYTDSNNYAIETFCGESRSSVSIGWLCALFSALFSLLTAFIAVCPCCQCVDRTSDGMGDNFVSAGAHSDIK
jgi:hypothetical protein